MKKSILMLALLAASSWVLQAAPCGIGSLESYITGTGCTIDGLFFNNFTYANPSSGGGISPDATGVEVIPQLVSPSVVGFEFIASWVAGTNQTSDGNISYTATCEGCQISDLELSMTGVGLGTGVASVAETSTSPMLSIGTADSEGFTKLTDSATFSPVGSITVTKDIGASGGDDGIGHVSTVTNLFCTMFTTAPEPTLAMFCAGMLLLIPAARLKFGRKATSKLA